MKRILCYGDSNTWGVIPHDDPAVESRRHDEHTRWGGVLRDTLGEGYEVVEDGLNGRTTIYDGAPDEEIKNGEHYLLPALENAMPLDLVIIMLGTNDLRLDRLVADDQLSKGIRRLIDLVKAHPECGRDGKAPAILVVSPILVCKPTGRQDFYEARGFEKGVERSKMFAAFYAQAAADTGCAFFDAAAVAQAHPLDALHMDAESHHALGKALAVKVKEIFA